MYAETSAKSREYISKRNYTDSFSLKVYGIEEETHEAIKSSFVKSCAV